jgi:hypothetical protein
MGVEILEENLDSTPDMPRADLRGGVAVPAMESIDQLLVLGSHAVVVLIAGRHATVERAVEIVVPLHEDPRVFVSRPGVYHVVELIVEL